MKTMRETIELLSLTEGQITDLGVVDIQESLECLNESVRLLASPKVDDALYALDAEHELMTQRTKEELVSDLKEIQRKLTAMYEILARVTAK